MKSSFIVTRLRHMQLEIHPMEQPPIWSKPRLEFQVLQDPRSNASGLPEVHKQ